MKLRNKQTGEIDDFIFEVITDRIDLYRRVGHSDTKNIWHYNSVTELNEEWEDAPEEPKEYWYIDYEGSIILGETDNSSAEKMMISIGNCFNTLSEAEKAVEKLKAWKRLKDKGFVFKGINEDDGSIKTGLSKGVSLNECEEFYCDMKLLFGGEE